MSSNTGKDHRKTPGKIFLGIGIFGIVISLAVILKSCNSISDAHAEYIVYTFAGFIYLIFSFIFTVLGIVLISRNVK
jgi:uncharacterized membrane protein YcjF (UPF0283 family)